MNRTLRIGLIAAVLVVAGSAFLLGHRRGASQSAPAEAARPSVLTVTATMPRTVEWPQQLQASGAIAAWQEAVISAETGSLRITDLMVDVGSVVTRGQELARLSQDSVRADLRKQEAAVAQAKASLAQAAAEARRARLVKDSGALSDQKITEYLIAEDTAKASLASAEAGLESARITLARTSIRAVDDGVITSRTANLGTVVSAGSDMFHLLRQGRVEWQAEMDAQQIAAVRTGQKARLTLPGGSQIEGLVRMAAPTLSSTTSRGIVYVSLAADSGARAGSFASGMVEVGSRPALVLPQSAVVPRDGRSYVFTIGDDGRVTRHVVNCGRRRDNQVEILEGIQAGARVVESGGAFLSDGAQVTVAKAESQS